MRRGAEVRPQVGGIILKRHFVAESNIIAEALLYQIDPVPYHANYGIPYAFSVFPTAHLSTFFEGKC